MIITDHAARRYIRRLAPSLTLDAARALLARVSRHARLLPQRTDAGQQLWQTSGAEGAVLVVKHDRASGPVVVTVLSEGQTREADDEERDEVRAAFERAERAREEQRRIDYEERGAAFAAAMRPRPPRPPPAPPTPKPVGKNKARRLAHEARQAAERAASIARKAERAAAHNDRMLANAAAKAARVAWHREESAVYWGTWAGVLP